MLFMICSVEYFALGDYNIVMEFICTAPVAKL